jgi:uncharacterized protein YneF (UPF0154 family)
VAQWSAVALGTVAALVTAFAVLGVLMGPFISQRATKSREAT